MLKGEQAYALQDYAGSLSCFSGAIARDPKFAQAYFHRGMTWYSKLNNKKAEPGILRATQLDPETCGTEPPCTSSGTE